MKETFKQVQEIFGTHPIYAVGGCVRDHLLGIIPKDWDFCTPLTPDEIEAKIKYSKNQNGHNRKVYLTGKRFGTVGFKLNDDKYVEVTSFRHEIYHNDRKPEVHFGANIEEDLSRRDFTINSLAYNGDKIIDLFHGQQDLQDKILRFIGSSKERINEDPLRMLRLFRFQSQLNFNIAKESEEKISDCAYKILNVSKERWVQEIDKILSTDNPIVGLMGMMKNDLFNYMIPELSLQYKYDQKSPYHVHDLWTHTLYVVDNVPKEDLNLRWAALLHDIGKPHVQKFKQGNGIHPDRMRYIHHDLLGADIAKSICEKLKFSNERSQFIVNTIKNHMQEYSILSQYDRNTNYRPALIN